jgi:hypothetical protein
MRRRGPHHNATTLDVLDHVLDKGVVVERRGRTPDTRADVSIVGLGVFGVDARVVVTDLDDDARARPRPIR